MNKIPATSQIISGDGAWFIFRDEERVIAAHNSILAKETIFINGEIVSERRSVKMKSGHHFNFKGNAYEIEFLVGKSFMEVECSLIKDGKCIERFKAFNRYQSELKASTRFWILVISGFMLGLLMSLLIGYLKMPFLYPSMMCIGMYFLINRMTKGKREFIVEKIDM
jgi:hypothetical protein